MKKAASPAEALQAQVIAEQRKEIARLQRALAKLEVKAGSEIAALKAKLAEEKKNKVKVVISRLDAGTL
jgi:phage host-nuclease inhibitor protein Gam